MPYLWPLNHNQPTAGKKEARQLTRKGGPQETVEDLAKKLYKADSATWDAQDDWTELDPKVQQWYRDFARRQLYGTR